ncbi:hypothetical protein CI238_05268, partial [Colletotrichum incanum]
LISFAVPFRGEATNSRMQLPPLSPVQHDGHDSKPTSPSTAEKKWVVTPLVSGRRACKMELTISRNGLASDAAAHNCTQIRPPMLGGPNQVAQGRPELSEMHQNHTGQAFANGATRLLCSVHQELDPYRYFHGNRGNQRIQSTRNPGSSNDTWARSPSATEQRNAPNDPGVGLLPCDLSLLWLVALERSSGRRVSHDVLPIACEGMCSESCDRTCTIRRAWLDLRVLAYKIRQTDMRSSTHQPCQTSPTEREIETSQQPYSMVASVFPISLAEAAGAMDGHGGQRTASAQFD